MGARRERQQSLDVAGEDVGLEVDAIAGDAGAERRRREGLRDQRHLEPVHAVGGRGRAGVADRERDAVHRDRALVDHERRQVGGQGDPHDAPLRPRSYLEHLAGAVDVTLHDVAAQAAVRHGGALEVHGASGGDPPQRRHVERLPHDIGGEPVRALVDDGEAHAADGDGVAVRGIRHRLRRAHRETHAVARRLDGGDLADFLDDSGEHQFSPSVAGAATSSRSAPRRSTSVSVRRTASPIVLTPMSRRASRSPPSSAGAR